MIDLGNASVKIAKLFTLVGDPIEYSWLWIQTAIRK